MELINKIKENKLPFTQEELNNIQEIVTTLEATLKPTTKTEALLLLADIEKLKAYSDAIKAFVKEKVSQSHKIHKEGVSQLKELEENIKKATQYDKVLEYANEQLAKDPLFTLKGTRKKKSWCEYIYDEQEIIKTIVTDEGMIPFLKIDKKKFDAWLEDNPNSKFNIETIQHREEIK